MPAGDFFDQFPQDTSGFDPTQAGEPGGFAGPAAQGTPVGPDGSTPTVATTGAPQGGSPSGSPFVFNQANVSAILQNYPHTPAGLQQAFAQHPELAAVSQIGGSKGSKIMDPTTGKLVQVVQSAGAGGTAWTWDTGGGPGAGGAPSGPVAGMGDLGWSALGNAGAGGHAPSVGSINATPLTDAKDYNPTATTGPDKLTLGTITKPGDITADQIKGPDALNARNVADPTGFKNLTADELQQDPSYQFRLQQGLGALKNQAAAKGLLQSGGFAKGLSDYAGQSASQEYQAANERARNTYQQNFQNQAGVIGQNNAAQAQAYGLTNQYQQAAAMANQGANLQAGQFNAGMNFNTQQANIANQLAAYNAYQPLNQQNQQFNASQAAQAAQNNFANRFNVEQANNANALGAFNASTNATLGAGQLGLGYTQAANSYNLGLGNLSLGNKQADQSYNLGMGNLGVSQGYLGLAGQNQGFNQGLQTFNTNYGVYRDNRDTAFNQGMQQAQLGYGASTNYGNNAGNYYTNQGNANAGAALYRGNAYAGALGTIANSVGQGIQSYYQNRAPQQLPYNAPQYYSGLPQGQGTPGVNVPINPPVFTQ